MPFDIVWAPVDSSSRLAAVFEGNSTISLPHFVDEASHPASRSKRFVLSARTLSLGILVTGGEPSRYVDFDATPEQLRALLRLAGRDMGVSSEDQLCSDAAAYLRHRHGDEVALTALRHASMIVPDGCLARGDLIVSLFIRATKPAGHGPPEELSEAAQHFRTWQSSDTSACRNEAMIFYCGLASLSFLGRTWERDAIVTSHGNRLCGFSWLQVRLARLRAAQAGCISDIRL
jgi:hypothetical protein